jgi:hypothetical protein
VEAAEWDDVGAIMGDRRALGSYARLRQILEHRQRRLRRCSALQRWGSPIHRRARPLHQIGAGDRPEHHLVRFGASDRSKTALSVSFRHNPFQRYVYGRLGQPSVGCTARMGRPSAV